jgi:hypothetical protein
MGLDQGEASLQRKGLKLPFSVLYVYLHMCVPVDDTYEYDLSSMPLQFSAVLLSRRIRN